MIIIGIMLFTMLFMWGALAISYNTANTENGTYLLGITLSTQYRKEKEVTEILAEYRKGFRRLTLFGFLGCFVVFPLNRYMSFLLLWVMVWYAVLIYGYHENIMKHARRLYQLKQEKGWLTGKPHIVRIDTVLSSIGNKGLISPWWWLPVWIMGIVGLVIALLQRTTAEAFLWVVVSLLVAMAGLTLADRGIRRMRKKVYCDNTQANQTINNTVQREWSFCILFHGYGIAIDLLLKVLKKYFPAAGSIGQDLGEINGLQGIKVALLSLSILFSFAIMLRAYYKCQKVKRQILDSVAVNGGELYGDDDEYWLNGTAQSGTNRLVEKRIGIGFELANTSANRGIEKGVLIFTAIFVAGIAVFLMPFDFAQVTLIMGEEKCRVEAAGMGHSFAWDEVQEITLLTEKPKMSKKSGYDSNRFYLGDFHVSGHGSCKVYVALETDSVIQVTTTDEKIFFNGENDEETAQMWEMLMLEIEKKAK